MNKFSDEAYKLAGIMAKFWDAFPSERENPEVHSSDEELADDAAEWAIGLLQAAEEQLAEVNKAK